MLDRAKHFVSDWATLHIQDEAFTHAVRSGLRPAALAAQCRTDAAALGISEQDLNKAAKNIFGAESLTACMALEIDLCARNHQAEVDRLRVLSTQHRALGKTSTRRRGQS